MLFRSAASGLLDKDLGTLNVAVTGAVYDYAKVAVTNAPLAFGNVRTDATVANRTLTFGNTTITDANYQDALLVATTANNGKLTATGATIAAGTTGNLTVAISTATAGSLADTLAVSQTSKAAAANLLDKDLGSLNVAVTGAVYDYAKATLASTSLALGNVRPGAADTLSVANEVITSSTYQDGLLVAATSANGNLTLTSPAKIAAGLTGNVGVKAKQAGLLDATEIGRAHV